MRIVPDGLSMDPRTVINALLFVLQTGLPMDCVPIHFGNPAATHLAIRRFTYGGGIEALKAVCAEDEHLQAIDFSGMDWMCRRRSNLPPMRRQKIPNLSKLLLSDEQWRAIADLVPDQAIREKGKKVIEPRTLVNAVLAKVRGRCAWTRIPTEFGPQRAVFLAIVRLVSCGAWDQFASCDLLKAAA